MKNDLYARVSSATRNTKLGAILTCAQQCVDPSIVNSDAPRFVGYAVVTSDGFLMCDFVDRNLVYRNGAFVGAMVDLDDNLQGLSHHLDLSADEKEDLLVTVATWISDDYRKLKDM